MLNWTRAVLSLDRALHGVDLPDADRMDCGEVRGRWDDVCSHVFVNDGAQTLLEAYGRDRGEHVVWLSRCLPKAGVQRFMGALRSPRLEAQSIPARRVRPEREQFSLRIPRLSGTVER